MKRRVSVGSFLTDPLTATRPNTVRNLQRSAIRHVLIQLISSSSLRFLDESHENDDDHKDHTVTNTLHLSTVIKPQSRHRSCCIMQWILFLECVRVWDRLSNFATVLAWYLYTSGQTVYCNSALHRLSPINLSQSYSCLSYSHAYLQMDTHTHTLTYTDTHSTQRVRPSFNEKYFSSD